MSAVIRPAVRSDLDALSKIENAVFPGDRLSRRSFAHLSASATAKLLVAERDGAAAGYCAVLFRAASTKARLYSIAVAADARGRGTGRRLMEDAARIVRKRGRARLRLEVRADNAAAIGLYEGLGYRRIGRHVAYYDDGMDALRLEREL